MGRERREGKKGEKGMREEGGSYRVMYALTLLGFGWEKRGM